MLETFDAIMDLAECTKQVSERMHGQLGPSGADDDDVNFVDADSEQVNWLDSWAPMKQQLAKMWKSGSVRHVRWEVATPH